MKRWEDYKVGDRFTEDGVEYEVTDVGVGDSNEPQQTVREVEGAGEVAPDESMVPWIVGGALTALGVGTVVLAIIL